MIRAAALACLLPGLAAAQEYDTMDRAQCEALLKRADMVQMGAVIEAAVLAPEDGWCRYAGLRLKGPNGYMDYGLDRARLRIGGAERLEHGLPPLAVELEIEGAHFAYTGGLDAGMRWLMTEQMKADGGIGLVLRAHWDREAKALVLEEASADFPWDNGVRLSARVEGIDLTDRVSTERSAPFAGVTALELELVTHGLFESVFMLPIGPLLLEGAEEPEARVAELKQAARAVVAGLPEVLLDEASREAALALLEDLPHPVGRLLVQVAAEPGLGMAQAGPLALGAAATPEGLAAVLAGVSVAVDYAGDRAP
ncbi:hypothetical protein [Vannielia litorea]|uniref:Uncharacterized protein n=1 Tax=Vannielia litorea TaxID=1217970 RepID=A0A1N6EI76_9RHOB|nr:hypothetical protein [Vannielia litorea]SIN82647.1 hypothetical protein SAMN05444002_0808 [Vannielia litorea]